MGGPDFVAPTIIVPTLTRCDGLLTATRAQQNAGMPSRTLVVTDHDRQGFTKTINAALGEVQGAAVILVDDCTTENNWLLSLWKAVQMRSSLKVWFAGPSGPCRTWPQNTGRRGDRRRPKVVSHVAGFCLYATSEAVAMGLDECFIHYGSDVDWQWRARRDYGARSLWVPSVYVEHGLHPPHQEWWEHDQRLLAEAWQ